uniref:Uncharacterized protein n=1 Tax=Rhizophora mucronata TaxID=61149 RepID=A0A2P2JQC9_RHIMU
MYRTIYHGRHTCSSKLQKGPPIIADPADSDSSIIIRFNNTDNFAGKQEGGPFPITSVKQEQDQEVMPLPGDLIYHNQSSSSNCLLSPDHFSAFDRADVISGVNSCTASTHSFDMDVMVGAVDFDDDVLQYVEFS